MNTSAFFIPLVVLTGFFGPFFGNTQEERTKYVSSSSVEPVQHEVLETSEIPALPIAEVVSLPQTEDPECENSEFYQKGEASWYGGQFHGRTMANGKIYNKYAYTVAHNELPFGTRVCINNPDNGKWVIATVTDRGGFQKYGRVIDLSRRVARDLDIIEVGTASVKIYVVET